MSEKLWTFRIRDMLESIGRIQDVTEDISFESFLENQDIRDIVERHFITIGEAAGRVPEQGRAHFSEVDWRGITGLRHIVVHDYDGVDYERVWHVIENRLEELREQLESVNLSEIE